MRLVYMYKWKLVSNSSSFLILVHVHVHVCQDTSHTWNLQILCLENYLSKHLSTLSDINSSIHSCSRAISCMSRSSPWPIWSHSSKVSGSTSAMLARSNSLRTCFLQTIIFFKDLLFLHSLLSFVCFLSWSRRKQRGSRSNQCILRDPTDAKQREWLSQLLVVFVLRGFFSLQCPQLPTHLPVQCVDKRFIFNQAPFSFKLRISN